MKYAVGGTYPCPNNAHHYTVLWGDKGYLLVSRQDNPTPFLVRADGTSLLPPHHRILAALPTRLWIKRSTNNEFSLHTEEPFLFEGEQVKTITF